MKIYQYLLGWLWGMGVLLGGMTDITFGLHPTGVGTEGESDGRKNPSSLNVRLSSRTIHPPKELIKETIPLEGIKAARPRVGPPPRAAIIEDDQRRRIVILSTDDTGTITAYVLENLDLTPHLSEVAFCAEEHHCEEDRMAITGGLGCIAICVKEVLDKLI